MFRPNKLKNGAKFEFLNLAHVHYIKGRYLDYAGEWCEAFWCLSDGTFAHSDRRQSDAACSDLDIDMESGK